MTVFMFRYQNTGQGHTKKKAKNHSKLWRSLTNWV